MFVKGFFYFLANIISSGRNTENFGFLKFGQL